MTEPKSPDRFDWLDAIHSEWGPKTHSARCVLSIIANHMSGKQQSAWPSQQTITERSGASKRQVMRLLKELERDGWIRRGWKGRHRVYWPLMPKAIPNRKARDAARKQARQQVTPVAPIRVTPMSPIAVTPTSPIRASIGDTARHTTGDISRPIGDIQRTGQVTGACHPNTPMKPPVEATSEYTHSVGSRQTNGHTHTHANAGSAEMREGIILSAIRARPGWKLANIAYDLTREANLTPQVTAAEVRAVRDLHDERLQASLAWQDAFQKHAREKFARFPRTSNSEIARMIALDPMPKPQQVAYLRKKWGIAPP